MNRDLQFIAWFALLWWVDHQFNQALSTDGWAQRNADKLVDFCHDLGIEANKLKVSSTLTTLSYHTLARRMEANKLDIVVFSRFGSLQVSEDLLEAEELSDKDIGLVNFISHDDQFLLGSKLDDILDGLDWQGSASWVARVYNADATNIGPFCLCLFVDAIEVGDIGAPLMLLLKVVLDWLGVQESECGSVKRVLRNGNHDTSVWTGGNNVEKGVDTGRGSSSQIDGFWIGRMTISLCFSI